MTKQRSKFTVNVDDNYHYMDESYRYVLGEFDSEQQALTAMQQLVNDFLEGHYKPGMIADELLQGYKGFGEDPWCAEVEFSAWDYAKQRCAELCKG